MTSSVLTFGSGTSLKIDRDNRPAKINRHSPDPGFLSMIFRLIEVRRNEFQSQLPLFEAKSSGYRPFDRRAELSPAAQFWCRSALPWSMDLTGVPQFEGQSATGPISG
jgi:hypothetical protein